METGYQNISTPSLLSTVELSMLAVIKVVFYGLQMGEIAPKPIDVHYRRARATQRYFLFSISSFLANFEVDILHAMVRHNHGSGRAWGVAQAQCCVTQHPEGELKLRPRSIRDKWVNGHDLTMGALSHCMMMTP